jgi:hypothetical protein
MATRVSPGIAVTRRSTCLAMISSKALANPVVLPPGRDHDVDPQPHELARDFGNQLISSLYKTPLDDEIPALDIAQLTHSLQKAGKWALVHGNGPRSACDEPDAPNLARLLRARGERPHGNSTAEKRD